MKGFRDLEKGFRDLEKGFSGLEKRFRGLEKAFGGLGKAFGGLEKGFSGLENASGGLENASGALGKASPTIHYSPTTIHQPVVQSPHEAAVEGAGCGRGGGMVHMIIAFLAFASIALPQQAASPPALAFKEEVTIKKGGYEVTIASRSFAKSEFRITKAKDGSLLLDGKRKWGVFMTPPRMRTTKVALKYMGKVIPVPSHLWADCFDLHLSQSDLARDPTLIKLDARKDTVLVGLLGGDGASGYMLELTLRKDGKHSRRVIVP